MRLRTFADRTSFSWRVSAFAADVDGKWTGSVSTPNGDFPQIFTFKADGATLTGSMTFMEGMDVPIADGKIDGENISFSFRHPGFRRYAIQTDLYRCRLGK